MRGTITVDESRCKGCELCVSVCPKNIISMASYFTSKGYHPASLNDPDGVCTGCLLCATICPEGGITVFRESKPASKDAISRNQPKAEPIAAGV